MEQCQIKILIKRSAGKFQHYGSVKFPNLMLTDLVIRFKLKLYGKDKSYIPSQERMDYYENCKENVRSTDSSAVRDDHTIQYVSIRRRSFISGIRVSDLPGGCDLSI